MYTFLKRFFDIIFSIILLIITFPILFFSIFLIIFFDFQNPFFTQYRSGIKGKKIKIIKLQTMKMINKKKEITKLGKILRLTKIDELPQLINILKNDMSLIGPRPLYSEFNQYYKKKHSIRLLMKPGITGLAQVKVKDSTFWERKFNFDSIYVRNFSFMLDIYIICKTIFIIFNSVFIKKDRIIETMDYKKNFFDKYMKLND